VKGRGQKGVRAPVVRNLEGRGKAGPPSAWRGSRVARSGSLVGGRGRNVGWRSAEREVQEKHGTAGKVGRVGVRG